MTEQGLFGVNGLGFGAYPFQQIQVVSQGTSNVTPLFNSETISQKIASLSTNVGKLEKMLKESGKELSKAERKKYENAIQQGKNEITRLKSKMEQVKINPITSNNGVPEIVKNERGTYDVKFDGQPNRTFTTKDDAKKFVDKQLRIKNSQVYPHMSGQTYANMLDTSAPVRQKNTAGTPSPWSQGAWDSQRVDLVGEAPADVSKPKKKPYVTPEVTVKTNKPKGFFGNIKNAVKGKKGKAALVAAGIAVVAGAIALFNGKDDNKVKKEEPVKPIVEEPVTEEISEQQEVIEPEKENQPENLADVTQTMPVAPVEEAAQPENESQLENLADVTQTMPAASVEEAAQPESEQTANGEYEVKKGDSVWKIAEQNLKDLHKDEPDYVPTDKEILMETRRIMKNNNLKLEEDKYHVLIKPGDILNLKS